MATRREGMQTQMSITFFLQLNLRNMSWDKGMDSIQKSMAMLTVAFDQVTRLRSTQ